MESVCKLAGHTDAVLCCSSSPSNCSQLLVASGGEDGRLCLHDLETQQLLHHSIPFEQEACSSAAFHPEQLNLLYIAAGTTTVCLDSRTGCSVVASFQHNKEEINSLAVNSKGTYLAAADDAGEVVVIDLTAGKLFKQIRNVHSNICTSVAFKPHKPWEVLTGGLDMTVAKYDFSRPKCIDRWRMQQSAAAEKQMYNPPFVHQLAVASTDERPLSQLVAVARGDGAVVVFDSDVSSAATASSAPKSSVATAQNGRNGRISSAGSAGKASKRTSEHLPFVVLDNDSGGHTNSASCVVFSGLAGHTRLFSGGNDRRLLAWDVAAAVKPPTPVDANPQVADNPDGSEGSCSNGADALPRPFVLWDCSHGRKINALCVAGDSTSEVLCVADTGKKLTLYKAKASEPQDMAAG